MPIMQCQKDGQDGFKWGENGVCFVGEGAREKAAAVGRVIQAQSLFELSENTSKRVQVAKVGAFDHEVYGEFSITLNDLNRMKFHLDNNSRRQEVDGKPVVPFDYKHDDENVAAGWITGLEVEKDHNNIDALFAEVEWTPKGAQKIKDKEFLFVSPDIRRNFKDKETGEIFDVILREAALTNIPFLRDMKAIHLLSESRRKAFESLKLSGDSPDHKPKKGSNMPKFKEILEGLKDVSPEDKKKLSEAHEAEKLKLSEKAKKEKEALEKKSNDADKALKLSEKETADLKEKMSGSDDMADRLKLAENETKGLKEKVGSLTKTLAENAKKSDFDHMLSEGKVCEAQRKPFMKNDMAEFAKNAQEVKLDESGENSKGDESMTGAEDKLIKLAEKRAKDDKIDYGDAMSLTLSENKTLAAKAGY